VVVDVIVLWSFVGLVAAKFYHKNARALCLGQVEFCFVDKQENGKGKRDFSFAKGHCSRLAG